MDRDLISLGSLEDWKFQGGDNLEWANPSYDDSDWTRFSPSGLSEPIPDSLWNNYGWFRLSFKADSSIYEQPWNLYFYTWGAAEVYLDGKLVHTYGKFSSTPEEEKTFMPISKLHRPIQILPKEKHLLAVRFSYHNGKVYKKYLDILSGSFGFGIGITGNQINDLITKDENNNKIVTYSAISMLLIIFILLSFFIYLDPKDNTYYYVNFIILFWIFHSITPFIFKLNDFSIFSYILIGIYYAILTSGLAISFYPFAISSIFNLKPSKTFTYLPYFVPILAISTIIWPFTYSLLFRGLFLILVIVFTVKILIKVKNEKQKGVGIATFGFLGSLIGILIAVFFENFFNIPNTIFSIFRVMTYVFIPLGMALLIGYRFFLLNINLENQVVERTAELNQSLENLKSTQAQLIQSEKMASLGELTAGIAHEIQNPLNFVNNFSEVSEELIDELQEEIENGEFDEVKLIASDLKENLSKINHHGKRAGAIVKGMLEHSRSNSREKSETDINALAEEYLKLSYHGLRAKDKSFEAYFKTDLDPDLPKIKVVTQDLGRVFLNLINNAFYAVNEKAKLGSNGYQPEVIVSSKKNENGVEISVKDNGNGIPDAIKEKIFQPFFTTKPTGSGTGLGLSLSYDIIKAHGGELRVISEEGKGTEMKITLPIHKDS
jgi:signal transduction histidine kinase